MTLSENVYPGIDTLEGNLFWVLEDHCFIFEKGPGCKVSFFRLLEAGFGGFSKEVFRMTGVEGNERRLAQTQDFHQGRASYFLIDC